MSQLLSEIRGEALLIPMNFMDEVKKNGLQADYSPMLAKNILNDSKLRSNQIWINEAPPETLANLLLCLCRSDIDDEKSLQILDSIAKVLELINDRKKDIRLNQRKFELALMNMVDNMESAKDPQVKWYRFYSGWKIIASYVGRLHLSIFNDTDVEPKISKRFLDSVDSINEAIDSLSERYARYWFRPIFGYGKNHDIVYKIKSDDDTDLEIRRRNEALFEINKRDESGTWVRVDWRL